MESTPPVTMPGDTSLTGPAPAQENSHNTSSSSSFVEPKNGAPNSPPSFEISTRFLMAFAALAVLTLMVALDGTSISVALPIIANKLHGTAIEAFWAGTSFLLASTVFQPTFASFSHIFGRMPVIMVSICLFFVGVIMAALANDFGLLLAGRSIQGIGGGGKSSISKITLCQLTKDPRHHLHDRDRHHRPGSIEISRTMGRDHWRHVVHW